MSTTTSSNTKTPPVLQPITTDRVPAKYQAAIDFAKHQHQHHLTQQHHSLPSPPLSSVHPTAASGFFLKSPLQERCEALEAELSSLRTRLKRTERTSMVREKRLSIFQQQSTDTHQALNTLRHQHELTLAQLKDAQDEAVKAKEQLQNQTVQVQQLKEQTQDQACQLKEVLLDRDSLSMEMAECHTDNAKFLKRLKASTDKVERLQQENRLLIEQLRELRVKVVSVSDEKMHCMEALDNEKHRGSKATLDLEQEVVKYKTQVDKLQELVLMMGNRHVQLQAQLQFHQQQAQRYYQQLQQQQQPQQSHHSEHHQRPSLGHASSLYTPIEHKALVPHNPNTQSSSTVSSTVSSTTASTTTTAAAPPTTSKHTSLMLGDTAITTLLASVATSSNAKRNKTTRRFTVNAKHQEAPLTLEQRKCEFLLDQISALQRGYDTLRQEKVTLELQVDLMQRQHQYHQQQRQKRRESQRRTLGHEQSVALSTALANITTPTNTPTTAQPPFSLFSGAPTTIATATSSTPASTPATMTGTIAVTTTGSPLTLLTRHPSSEAFELAQARKLKELEQEKERERLARAAQAEAQAAAEEAARQEAIQQKKLKDLHLKEALASLESKRGRSDSRNVTFTSSEELKHLEHLRLAHQEENNSHSGGGGGGLMSPVTSAFQAAVNARASRRIGSPLSTSTTPKVQSPAVTASSTSSTSSSPFFASSSPLSSAVTPASSFSSGFSMTELKSKDTSYTQPSPSPLQSQHRVYSRAELDIQQCSCCIGNMIEI
ncbi:hypothetical protein BGZ94_009972 [Podila epigama]|nr:hypothetical protein BGZ94_009972 [Podila epigama]